MKLKLKNHKGQAAMTDSLFFLTIIVALCVLLFQFSATYGERVDLAINNLYFKEYTNSSLKTIYYTDIPLDTSKNIEESLETDYLITSLKSDYLSDGKIGYSDINSLDKNNVKDLSKYNLFHTIKSLMYALPNYDYIYYIQESSGQEFIYFMLKINNFKDNKLEQLYYLCEPVSINPVRNMVQRTNKIYSSSSPQIYQKKNSGEVRATSNLTIWPSTSSINKEYLEGLEGRLESLTENEIENINNLKCKEYIEEED